METSEKSKSSFSTPKLRFIYLYCLVVFNKLTGNSRVWTFRTSDALVDAFCQIRLDSDLYPSTFTHKMIITEGHPLYKYGADVSFDNCTLRIKK